MAAGSQSGCGLFGKSSSWGSSIARIIRSADLLMIPDFEEQKFNQG